MTTANSIGNKFCNEIPSTAPTLSAALSGSPSSSIVPRRVPILGSKDPWVERNAQQEGRLHRILVMMVWNQRRRVLYRREKETVDSMTKSGRRKEKVNRCTILTERKCHGLSNAYV